MSRRDMAGANTQGGPPAEYMSLLKRRISTMKEGKHGGVGGAVADESPVPAPVPAAAAGVPVSSVQPARGKPPITRYQSEPPQTHSKAHASQHDGPLHGRRSNRSTSPAPARTTAGTAVPGTKPAAAAAVSAAEATPARRTTRPQPITTAGSKAVVPRSRTPEVLMSPGPLPPPSPPPPEDTAAAPAVAAVPASPRRGPAAKVGDRPRGRPLPMKAPAGVKSRHPAAAVPATTATPSATQVAPSNGTSSVNPQLNLTFLSRRWGEIELLLRQPIRTGAELDKVRQAADTSIQFLDQLTVTAGRLGILAGTLSRWLLPFDTNTPTLDQAAGNRADTDDSKYDLSAAEKQQLINGATTLRSLVRVKIADDADLDQAREATVELLHFLKLLREYAEGNHQAEIDVLRSL